MTMLMYYLWILLGSFRADVAAGSFGGGVLLDLLVKILAGNRCDGEWVFWF